jgi:hypothetical protein
MHNELNDSLNQAMYDNIFIHRGVIVERMIGGYRCLSQVVKSMEEVDNIITQSQKTISESIQKGLPNK